MVRGGFGVYYVDYTINEFRNSINVAPFVRRAQLSRSLLLSQNVNVNQLFTFQNPTANSNAAGADTQLTTLDGFFPDYPTMRLYSWNLTIEKDLGWGMGLRSSYVGNIGRQLVAQRPRQRLPARPDRVPVTCRHRSDSSASGRNLGSMPDSGQATASRTSMHWEIELQKRFSNGLLFDVNYSFARAFNYQFQASDPVADAKSRYDYGPGGCSSRRTSSTGTMSMRFRMGVASAGVDRRPDRKAQCLAAGSCRGLAPGSRAPR